MSGKKDWFLNIVEGIADSAVAPVKAVVEVICDGDVSDETAKSLFTGGDDLLENLEPDSKD